MREGILYEIRNKMNGKCYVGVTMQTIKQRMATHLYRLRREKATEKLQSDYNKYGEDSFDVNILEKGNLADMYLLEKELSKQTVLDGYNTIIGGGDIEERKASSAMLRKKLNEDVGFREAYCNKLSIGNKGRVVSEESKLKMSKAKSGRRWKAEHRENRKKAFSGNGNPNAGNYKIFLNINTGIYYTRSELVSYLGISQSSLTKYFKTNDDKVSSFIKT